MDPDKNLEEQIELAKKILYASGDHVLDADRLAELVLALNDWIQLNGVLPNKWSV